MNYYYWVALLIWNMIVMFLYGVDKFKAKRGKRRISEATLLAYAFMLGGWGAMFGMVLFNHKTSKAKFRTLVPIMVLLETAAIYLVMN